MRFSGGRRKRRTKSAQKEVFPYPRETRRKAFSFFLDGKAFLRLCWCSRSLAWRRLSGLRAFRRRNKNNYKHQQEKLVHQSHSLTRRPSPAITIRLRYLGQENCVNGFAAEVKAKEKRKIFFAFSSSPNFIASNARGRKGERNAVEVNYKGKLMVKQREKSMVSFASRDFCFPSSFYFTFSGK